MAARENRRADAGLTVEVNGLAVARLARSLALALALSSCASGEFRATQAYQERSVEQLYEEAFDLLERRRWLTAAQTFNEVERQHPYSIWAQRATLMSAYALYRARRHEESLASARQYIALYPGARSAPYAYYLVAINHFGQMLDVERDQKQANLAKEALQELIARFPTSEYAYDATIKLELVRDQLAGQAMRVGLHHLRERQFLAALTRYRTVIEEFDGTAHVPEALYRMVEIWLTLGVDEEALRIANMLGYNFGDDLWYERAYTLLQRLDLAGAAAG